MTGSAPGPDPGDEEVALGLVLTEPLPDEAAWRREFPAAWHERPSRAEIILAPLSISARRFVDADRRHRDLLIDGLAADESRRLLWRSVLCLTVAIGFAVIFTGMWLLVTVGGVALKAGTDLGRYVSRMRALKAARGLGEADLEIEEPR